MLPLAVSPLMLVSAHEFVVCPKVGWIDCAIIKLATIKKNSVAFVNDLDNPVVTPQSHSSKRYCYPQNFLIQQLSSKYDILNYNDESSQNYLIIYYLCKTKICTYNTL